MWKLCYLTMSSVSTQKHNCPPKLFLFNQHSLISTWCVAVVTTVVTLETLHSLNISSKCIFCLLHGSLRCVTPSVLDWIKLLFPPTKANMLRYRLPAVENGDKLQIILSNFSIFTIDDCRMIAFSKSSTAALNLEQRYFAACSTAGLMVVPENVRVLECQTPAAIKANVTV